MGMSKSARRNSRKGFSLLLAGCCLTVIIGMFGLTVDLGRIYVVKSGIQAFADAAAMAAALRLNGTTNGVTSAQTIGIAGPGSNRWNFNSQNVPANNVTVTFGTTKDGPWLAANSIGNGAGYRFVRVNVTAGLPMYFARIFQGVSPTQTVNAVATAGQFAEPNPGKWLDPFSPDALSSTDPNFGYQYQNNTRQNLYTLVWPPKGHRTVKCGAMGAWMSPRPQEMGTAMETGVGVTETGMAMETEAVAGTAVSIPGLRKRRCARATSMPDMRAETVRAGPGVTSN